MIGLIDKINRIIDKIGKRNFVIAIFVLFVVIISGLYGTFSLFTSSEGVSVIDDIKTYKFILGSSDDVSSVTIPSLSSKYVAITVSNSEDRLLKYGIFYSSSSSLESVDLGYLSSSDHFGSGNIDANSDYMVTIKVYNATSSSVTIDFGIVYGLESGGDLTLPTGKSWLEEYTGPVLATDKIIDLYNDGTEIVDVNIGRNISKPLVKLNYIQGIMLDNNGDYRYYGKNPNNFVKFNDELWRIISISNVENEKGKFFKRMKIVRDTAIGTFPYDNKVTKNGNSDSDYVSNSWVNSGLMMLLNPGFENLGDDYPYDGSLYWYSRGGTCYGGKNQETIACDFSEISDTRGLSNEAKAMIGMTKFYLGGSSSYEGLYADDYYDFERKTLITSKYATEWVGYVGLMYPSDYVYATDLSLCFRDGLSYKDDASCYNNDWLFDTNNQQWLMNPSLTNLSNVFYIDNNGSVTNGGLNNDIVYATMAVKSVVYLNSDVNIVSGMGTRDKPYQLQG